MKKVSLVPIGGLASKSTILTSGSMTGDAETSIGATRARNPVKEVIFMVIGRICYINGQLQLAIEGKPLGFFGDAEKSR